MSVDFLFTVMKYFGIMVLLMQLCEYTAKNHWTVHIKWLKFMLYQLYVKSIKIINVENCIFKRNIYNKK